MDRDLKRIVTTLYGQGHSQFSLIGGERGESVMGGILKCKFLNRHRCQPFVAELMDYETFV